MNARLGRPAIVVGFALLCMVVVLLSKTAGERATAESKPADLPSTEHDRSGRGAVLAALDLLTRYGSPQMYDQAQRARLLPTMTATSAGEAAVEELDAAFALAARTLSVDARGRSDDGELVSRLVPVGQRTLSFDGTRAEVAVWAVGLLGVAGASSPVPVAASWSTETFGLEWTADGWRLVSLDHADGPTPVGSPQIPSGAAEIADAAREFSAVSHAR